MLLTYVWHSTKPLEMLIPFQTLKRNREQCELLRDRLLRLLPVVIIAVRDLARGKTDRSSSLNDLKRNVDQFHK